MILSYQRKCRIESHSTWLWSGDLKGSLIKIDDSKTKKWTKTLRALSFRRKVLWHKLALVAVIAVVVEFSTPVSSYIQILHIFHSFELVQRYMSSSSQHILLWCNRQIIIYCSLSLFKCFFFDADYRIMCIVVLCISLPLLLFFVFCFVQTTEAKIIIRYSTRNTSVSKTVN